MGARATVSTRMSGIFRPEGWELVLVFCGRASRAWSAHRPAPKAATPFRNERRRLLFVYGDIIGKTSRLLQRTASSRQAVRLPIVLRGSVTCYAVLLLCSFAANTSGRELRSWLSACGKADEPIVCPTDLIGHRRDSGPFFMTVGGPRRWPPGKPRRQGRNAGATTRGSSGV